MAALSDARYSPEHDFALSLRNDAERSAILVRIRAIAEFEVRSPGVALPANLTASPSNDGTPAATNGSVVPQGHSLNCIVCIGMVESTGAKANRHPGPHTSPY